MIDMRMTEHDRINAADIERERIAVKLRLVTPALNQPAIEQNTKVACLDQMARSGNAFCRTQTLDMHYLCCPQESAIEPLGNSGHSLCRHILVDFVADQLGRLST